MDVKEGTDRTRCLEAQKTLFERPHEGVETQRETDYGRPVSLSASSDCHHRCCRRCWKGDRRGEAQQFVDMSSFRSHVYLYFALFCTLVPLTQQVLNEHNQKLEWIVGKWRSEFSGKIFWPTVPTMTFGEELVINEAPIAKSANVQFLNFSARAWSHSTKDHFHDEWGFLTVDPVGNATLMTTGNNGFTTYEVGTVSPNKLVLTLKDIGRISFSRDLPVEDLRRTFIRHDDRYMEQVIEMRTATHPKVGYLEHTRVVYTKLK